MKKPARIPKVFIADGIVPALAAVVEPMHREARIEELRNDQAMFLHTIGPPAEFVKKFRPDPDQKAAIEKFTRDLLKRWDFR